MDGRHFQHAKMKESVNKSSNARSRYRQTRRRRNCPRNSSKRNFNDVENSTGDESAYSNSEGV